MNKTKTGKKYLYSGVIHIHSIFSDGTGDVEQISRSAKKAGLDFVIITDHNNFDIEEGFFNDVCVIKGEEISPDGCNHYVAIDIDSYIDYRQPVTDFIKEVRTQGGFGFAVHPDEGCGRKNFHKPIKWLDKNIKPDGVEIWNWFSNWADGYCDKNIFTIAYAFLFRHSLITKPSNETLKWWDILNNNAESVVPAIGGVDAHAMKVRDYIIPVTIFPYSDMFKTITNVLTLDDELSSDFQTAKKQILKALKNGRNIIVNRKISKEIPLIYITDSVNTNFCGESVNFDNNLSINVVLHNMFEIKLIHNGIVIFNQKAKSMKFLVTEKGKYRVELSLGDKGFAYSNPIVVN